MYSQNQEEAVITSYFTSNDGRFLDIGAFDGINLSNTRKLLENGWSGVLVEPSPIVFTKLLDATADYADKVQLANIALTPDYFDLTVWRDSMGEAISTISQSHVQKWSSHKEWREFYISPVHIIDFCNTFGNDFDFISIDVEGINWQLLSAMPGWMFDKCRMVCIEYDSHMNAITELMVKYGFKIIHRNGENLIFVK